MLPKHSKSWSPCLSQIIYRGPISKTHCVALNSPVPWQVIHRDLKPRNLLVNSNCDLKVQWVNLGCLVILTVVPQAFVIYGYKWVCVCVCVYNIMLLRNLVLKCLEGYLALTCLAFWGYCPCPLIARSATSAWRGYDSPTRSGFAP